MEKLYKGLKRFKKLKIVGLLSTILSFISTNLNVIKNGFFEIVFKKFMLKYKKVLVEPVLI